MFDDWMPRMHTFRFSSLLLLICAGLMPSGVVSARPAPAVQGAPATDIYVAELKTGPDGPVLGALKQATDREGYDNQPAFISGGKAFLYSSIDGAGQADIYRYDLETGRRVQLTHTPESEFSPTPLPDASGFAVVRVEKDDAQRLWAFAMDGSHPHLLKDKPADIGYFAWPGSDPADVLAMLVQKPLVAARLRPGKEPVVIAQNPGRCFRKIPDSVSKTSALSLVVKHDAGHWDVMRYIPSDDSLKELVATPIGSEDFAWTPGGWLIMAQHKRLLAWRPGLSGWHVIADLSQQLPGDISRLAVSANGAHIAFVADRHLHEER